MDKAIGLLNVMDQEGLSSDRMTYNSLIAAYCQNEMMNEAIEQFNSINVKGMMPDKITVTTLIKGFFKRVDDALRLFIAMQVHHGYGGDAHSYTGVIDGLCKTK